jgi:hypothetical protein
MDGASVSLTRTADGWQTESKRHAAQGQHKQYPLQVAVELDASEGQARRMLWPTPVATDATGVVNATKPNRDPNYHAGTTLTDAIKLWPTPQSFDANDCVRSPEALERAKEIGGCANLREHPALRVPEVAAQNWPTPTSRDWKDGANPSDNAPSNCALGRAEPRDPMTSRKNGEAGALSASWVETLMGFPPGWTDIPPGWKPPKPPKPTPSPRTGPRAPAKPNTPGSPRAPRAKRKTAPPG